MASRPVTLPPGFVLEQPQGQKPTPNLPEGFVLEQPSAPQLLASHPSAPSRFVQSFSQAVGAPERMSDIPEGIQMAVSHPVRSAKLVGQSMADAQQSVIDKAYEEQHSPGIANKLKGVVRGVYASLPLVGPVMSKAADQFGQGDIAGGAGTMTGLATASLMGNPEARANVTGGIKSLKPTNVLNSKPSIFPGKQGNVVPEAAKLPRTAVNGAEDLFQASAPTGMNKGYRVNTYVAAGDLAEIGRKLDLAESKGGIINPDMRVRATVNAISDHLNEMYQNEVAPKFAKAPNAEVTPSFNGDAKNGLSYIAKNAEQEATRNLAAKALAGKPLTLTEAYDLAKTTNTYLLGYESMTAAEKAAAGVTGRKLAGLKPVDVALSETINQALNGLGESGIKSFERRYAALASIRYQLENRMNAVELNRPGVLKGVVQPIGKVMTGGKSGIASASQAAVADVNIGRKLQSAFRKLADSGITAERDVPVNTQVRGLLERGSLIPPEPADISGSTPYKAPTYSATTRAQRLGLLLPEKSGAPTVLPPPAIEMTPGEWLSYVTSELRRPMQKRLPAKVQPIPLGPSKR